MQQNEGTGERPQLLAPLLPEYLSPTIIYKSVLLFLLGLLGNNRLRYEGEAVQCVWPSQELISGLPD